MGFYGSVFYELSNAFASFLIKSTVKDEEGTKITAMGKEDILYMSPANEWIELLADDSKHEISVKHALTSKSRSTKGTISSAKEQSKPTGATQLDDGDTFSIPIIKYDEAGHVIDASGKKYFTLPVNQLEIDVDSLQARMSKIEATEESQNKAIEDAQESFEELLALNLGELASRVDETEIITQAVKDHPARMIAVEEICENVKDLPDRVVAVEEICETVKDLPDRVVATEGVCETVRDLPDKVVALEEKVGTLGSISEITENENATFASIIGDFDSTIGAENKNTDICSYVAEISGRLNGTNITMNNQALATELILRKLCNALADNGIEIDYDSLT